MKTCLRIVDALRSDQVHCMADEPPGGLLVPGAVVIDGAVGELVIRGNALLGIWPVKERSKLREGAVVVGPTPVQ